MSDSVTPRSSGSAPPSGSVLLGSGSAALLAMLVYLNGLHNPFVYDDYRLIRENPSLVRLGDWWAILVHDMTRPLLNFSYAVDYAIWGPNPFGFHLTNVLLHAINVVLLFRFAYGVSVDYQSTGTTKPPTSAWTVAMAASALFAVHPAMSQAVGWASGRSELLCFTWFLIALLSARRCLASDSRRSYARWWAVIAGAWLLALASKETAATFPLVLCAYDYFIVQSTVDGRRSKVRRLYVPLGLLALVAAVVRLTVLATVEYPGAVAFQWEFAMVKLDVFRRYLGLILFPTGQTIFHAISPIHSLGEPRGLLGLATVATFLLLVALARRVNAVAGFGLAWFALLFVPSAILVVLDRGEPMAEHRIYLSSAGLFMSIGVVVSAVATRLRKINVLVLRQGLVVAILVIGILGLRTMARNVVWSRPVGLWLEAAEYAPDHWLPRLALGEVLHEQGRHEEAIGALRAAVALRPEETVAYAKLGQCLLETGRIDEANATFQRFLRLDAHSPVPYGGLGLVAMHSGDSTLARRYFLEVLARDPQSVPARRVLADIEEASNPREALRLCEEIGQLAPHTPGNDDCISRNRARVVRDASVGR